MKKITDEAQAHFWYGCYFKLSNTEVKNSADNTSMFLHGNRIAMFSKLDNTLTLSSCGWQSNITKERLNGVLDRTPFKVFQKDYTWYLRNTVTKEIIPFSDHMVIDCTDL